jgi:phenylalanyl-tRNA synthetase beta chain
VLIECAYFDPDHIARTGQKLTLTSDARSRFERGVDPAFLEDGLAIATRMVLDICGGTASGVTRSGEPPVPVVHRRYDPARAETLGGLAVAEERAGRSWRAWASRSDADWTVTVPSWRRDVDGSADLVEEVIRIEGIDNVPSTPLDAHPGVARRPRRPSRSSSARRAAPPRRAA